MPDHVVVQGECLSSIARKHGCGVDTIWNHDKNKPLRDKRKSPNVLYVGDVVFLPDLQQKEVKVASNATHQFQVKIQPAELRLCLLAGGKPVKDATYSLFIDGVDAAPKKPQKTDGKGMVIAPIAAVSKSAIVSVPKLGTVYAVDLGHLDPTSHVTGAKERLRQLGYHPGPSETAEGQQDPWLDVGVWLFQNNHGLVATGALDDATKDELEKQYGT